MIIENNNNLNLKKLKKLIIKINNKLNLKQIKKKKKVTK